MTNIDIANGIVFQAMSISNDSFDNRIIAQKKIYLLQELGIDIGYSYNWYLRGPYSPDLTTYIYNNIDMLKDQQFSDVKLTDKAQVAINTVNGFASSKPSSLSVASWYELLASIHYIICKMKSAEPCKKLISLKPQYSEEQYNIAHELLVGAGLVS